MASLVGRLVSLPSARDSAPLNVIILKENGVEEWHRDFDGDIMRSTLRARDGRLSERLGAARFEFALLVQDNAIIWQLRKVVFLGVPLPIVWFREVYAREYSKAGRYRFDVGASLPLIGRLIQYRGELLTEEIDEDVETTHSN